MILTIITDTGSNIGSVTVPDGSAIPNINDYVFAALHGPVYQVTARFFTRNGTTLQVYLQGRQVAPTTDSTFGITT